MTAAANHPNSTGQPVLAVSDMHFTWPASSAMVNISELIVSAGDHWLLEGPSGSGKSTLLQLLGGVLLPQRGRIELLGRNWSDLSAPQRDRRRADSVGFVFQQFNLVPYLSALENVLLPCPAAAGRTRPRSSGSWQARGRTPECRPAATRRRRPGVDWQARTRACRRTHLRAGRRQP